MWKLQNFSVVYVLREVKLKLPNSESQKLPFKTHLDLEYLNFDSYEFPQYLNAEMYQIDKFQTLESLNWPKGSFRTSRSSKIG